MMGLLYKEMKTLKTQVILVLLMAIFFLLMDLFTENSSTMVGAIAVLSIMMSMTTMAYDEKVNWNRFVLTTPVTKSQIVGSKYLLGIFFTVALSLIFWLFRAIGKGFHKEQTVFTVALMGMALLYLAVIMPILFKFGVEKARYIFFAIIFLPLILVPMIFKNLDAGVSKNLVEFGTKYGFLIGCVLVVVLLLGSHLLSVRIVDAKEF